MNITVVRRQIKKELIMISNEISIIFSQRLKKQRLQIGITQEFLAMELQLTPSTIWKYENARRFPRLPGLVSIADYFNISIDYLLGRTDNPVIPK